MPAKTKWCDPAVSVCICVCTFASVTADVYFSEIADMLTTLKLQKNSGTFFIFWDFSTVKKQGQEEQGSEGLDSYLDKINGEQSGILFTLFDII